MSEDRRRPGQHASLRDEALRRWLTEVVYPYSSRLRPALDRAGLGPSGVRTAADLGRLPVLRVGDLGDGRDWVLEPTEESVRQHGDLVTRGRLLVAEALGRRREFSRAHVDEPFKPVVWTAAASPAGVLLVASSRVDLDRLAGLGRRSLSISGVQPDDRVLLLGTDAGVGPVQLTEGCRDAGIAVLRLPVSCGSRVVADAAPTVVSGSVRALRRHLADGLPQGVRLLVVHAATVAESVAAQALSARTRRPVSVWWAPTGTRAAWVACPGGTGYHTWPTHEVLEVVDDAPEDPGAGALVWSAVGWHGSVWLRVALGVSGRVDEQPCPNCRRTTPRVLPDAPRAVAT